MGEEQGSARVPYATAPEGCTWTDRGSDPGRGTKRERQVRTDDQKELCMLWPVNSFKT